MVDTPQTHGAGLPFALAALAVANVPIQFAFQWYPLLRLGAGAETDALFAAMVLPQIVLAVVGGSLSQVLVPLLANQSSEAFGEQAWTFFQSIGLLLGAIALLLGATAGVWVPWTVPGFSPATLVLAIALARIQLVGMVFSGLLAVGWSSYQARHRFIWVELSTCLCGLAAVAVMVATIAAHGVAAVAWAASLRSILQVALLLPGLGRYKTPRWRSPATLEAWRRLRVLVVGTVYYKTDQLVDRFLASMAPVGQLSLLYLGQQLYGAGNLVLNKAIAGPMLPMLAQRAENGDWDGFRRVSRSRLAWVTGLTTFGYVVTLVAGRPLIRLGLGYGRFGAQDVSTLWMLLIALAGVLIGGAAGQVLTLSFYAYGNTTTPTKVGVFGFSVGLALKIFAFRAWGVLGVALATSTYMFLTAVLHNIFLTRDINTRLARPPPELV